MKAYLPSIIALLVGLFFAGCSKDGDEPRVKSEYYFRYKVDGTQQDYEYGNNQINLVGSHGYDPNTKTFAINIAGIRNIMESGKSTITILISATKDFTTGVNYSNIPGAGDDYPDFLFTMGYYDPDGNLYVAGGQGDSPIYAELYEPAFIKITEMTEDYMAGTFSGTLIWYNTAHGKNEFIDSVVISEGTFKVPRSK
jgi:hypothetical protein